VPIPPSGPNESTSYPPPPSLISTSLSISKSLNFGMLPKSLPSRPSGHTLDPPPPPTKM
ncbi:hypothetical protein Gohar_011659, partial [Gossypium harknessii]|nr:hypothetical protein [Gossypium harknessii]